MTTTAFEMKKDIEKYYLKELEGVYTLLEESYDKISVISPGSIENKTNRANAELLNIIQRSTYILKEEIYAEVNKRRNNLIKTEVDK